MSDEDSGDAYPRGIDAILVDLATVYTRLAAPGVSDGERAEIHLWQADLRREAAAARDAMPFDREWATRRVVQLEHRINDILGRHINPGTAGVGESGGGGIDAYMLLAINNRIDSGAGVDALRDERRRLLADLADLAEPEPQ